MPLHPFIASEEYYLDPSLPCNPTGPGDPDLRAIPPVIISKLRNLGPSRTRDMRASNVSLQVVSHIPIDATPNTCRKLNDALSSTIVTSPDHLAALALLPCWNPTEAASELLRCVTSHGFVGGMLGFRRGEGEEKAYDGAGFDGVWKVAERYRVPIALRPLFPPRERVSFIFCVEEGVGGCG